MDKQRTNYTYFVAERRKGYIQNYLNIVLYAIIYICFVCHVIILILCILLVIQVAICKLTFNNEVSIAVLPTPVGNTNHDFLQHVT
jgi:hypothetical protein